MFGEGEGEGEDVLVGGTGNEGCYMNECIEGPKCSKLLTGYSLLGLASEFMHVSFAINFT